MRELLDALPLLRDALWQSTAFLAAGLVGARLLRRRPARSHAWLLACLVAAALTPLATAAFRDLGWGLGAPWAAAEPGAPRAELLTGAGSRPAELGPWVRAVPLLWLAASAWLLARLALGLAASHRWLARSRPAPAPLARLAAEVAADLGLAAGPTVRVSAELGSPVIWCWRRRPVVLVPADLARYGRARLAALLAHELAHWRRCDHASALVADLVRALLPWHPGAWACARLLRQRAEEACDDWALAHGADPLDYADTLLSLVPCAEAQALAARGSSAAGRRILRLLGSEPGPPPRAGSAALAAIAALSLGGGLLLALLQPRRAELPEPSGPAARVTLAAVEPGSGPLVFAPAELDLGPTPPGRPARGHFALANVGDAPLHVRTVRPTCGCTTLAPEVEDRWLAPGEQIDFTVQMEPSPTVGEEKTRSVVVAFDGHEPIALPLRLRTAAPEVPDTP